MQLFVGLVQFHASFLLGVCYEAYCSLLYLRATRAIAQYCVGVFYFGPMIPEQLVCPFSFDARKTLVENKDFERAVLEFVLL